MVNVRYYIFTEWIHCIPCYGNKLFYDLKADWMFCWILSSPHTHTHTHKCTIVAPLLSFCGSHVFDFFHLALRVWWHVCVRKCLCVCVCVCACVCVCEEGTTWLKWGNNQLLRWLVLQLITRGNVFSAYMHQGFEQLVDGTRASARQTARPQQNMCGWMCVCACWGRNRSLKKCSLTHTFCNIRPGMHQGSIFPLISWLYNW